MEPHSPQYGTSAYIEQHLQEAGITARILSTAYKDDFNSFFYRPNFDHFLRHEILPLVKSPTEYLNFFDTDHWGEKNPFNFPGPFYSAFSDTCGTGSIEAPHNVLSDGDAQEYVFRQPSNYPELICVIDAGLMEVLESYSCNGNDHWTYAKCKEWWNSRFDLIDQFRDPKFEKVNGKDSATLYADYLSTAAELDLKRYCYFLENGKFPPDHAPLPSL